MKKPAAYGFIATAAFAIAACSDVRLEFPDPPVEPPEVNNLLDIDGSYCTSPAADVPYPVKIMFIVDGSGSQQFADQNRQRVVAVEETINALIGSPNVYFKVIVFNASISAVPSIDDPTVFTNDMAVLVQALTNLAEADTLTDYQGALAVAYSELLRDMTDVLTGSASGPTELARTKYVTIFVSDGLPDPQCLAGLCNDLSDVFPPDPNCGGLPINRLCEDQDFLNCLLQADGTTCSGGVCDYNGTLCFEQPDANNLFGGINNTELAGGNDYNQPYQILQKVADIKELEERFDVGELRVHAGLVLDPLADPAVIAVFGDPARAAPMMREVAAIGEGQYMEFYGGDSIDFLSLNFDTIKQQRVVRNFFAYNHSVVRGPFGLIPDTDQDGLTDEEEFAIGSDAKNPDTDGDGFGDAVEWRLRGYSFRFDNPCLPPLDPACDPAAPTDICGAIPGGFMDSDRDGLHDCEEVQLGTNPYSPDTDADGINDRMDFYLGLDPLVWDFDQDADQDSTPNGTEIMWHLNVLRDQSPQVERERYRYDVRFSGLSPDGRSCYDFSVRKLQLGSVGEPEMILGQGVGYNYTWFYLTENMADSLAASPLYRVACLRSRFVPPALKKPADGFAAMREDDFWYYASEDPLFNQTQYALKILPEVDPEQICVEACSGHEDCAACPMGCVEGVCRQTDWLCCSDDDCGGQRCIAHACRAACAFDNPCQGETESCVEGYCWEVCTVDGDCPRAGQTCVVGICQNLPLEPPPQPADPSASP